MSDQPDTTPTAADLQYNLHDELADIEELIQLLDALDMNVWNGAMVTRATVRRAITAEARVKELAAENARLRAALQAEQDLHGNTCEFFREEIRRKMLAHGKSLETLVATSNRILDLVGAAKAVLHAYRQD